MTDHLILGQSGQVARELARRLPAEASASFAGRETLDLLTGDVGALIREVGPRAVINAAAYTAVDRAETEADAAFRLNRDVPAEAARACAALDIPFVHISTDYVFAGDKPRPYVETDPRDPLGVYGRSKAEGEIAVEEAGGRSAILRTAWVYSPFGSNFVRTMLRLAETRDELGVVADQQGNPTHARDVAHAAVLAADRLRGGVRSAGELFHVAGGGDATWADLAEAVFEEAGRRGRPTAAVRRITTADYPTPARRPANSRLSTAKLERTFGWRPPEWRDSLSAVFDDLEREPS